MIHAMFSARSPRADDRLDRAAPERHFVLHHAGMLPC
jgi:hypothetical protein